MNLRLPIVAERTADRRANYALIISNPRPGTLLGLAIMIVAIGYNTLGDGLRHLLDPRLKR